MPFGQARYAETNELLNQRFAQKQVLICAHRGSWHGNVIQNTTMAYKAALMQGADIVETDTTASRDGVVFSLHDGVESVLFGCTRNSTKLSAELIESYHTLNALGEPSTHHVQRLSEVFEFLRHGELLNIDRAWRAGDGLLPLIDRYPHMRKQAILKAPMAIRPVIDAMENHPVKYMFMPICYSLREVEEALAYKNVNLVGIELIAFTPQDDLFSNEAIEYIHSKGLYCWVNTLTLTDVPPYNALYGGLDDDRSIWEGPQAGWGALVDKGIDVLQTDWPDLVRQFRAEKLGV